MKRIFKRVLVFVLTFVMLFAYACGDPKPKEYTVTFDSNGGSAVTAQVVADGATATKPTDPTRAKYHFKNWYKDKAGAEIYSFDTKVTKDLTLYAVWQAFEKYTVTFDTKGGTLVAAQEVEEGQLVTKPTDPTRARYEFAGWYYDYEEDGLTEERLWDFETGKPTGDLTINAHWTQTHYALNFVTDTVATIDPQTVAFGDKVTEPDALTKEGHTFVGWYTSTAYNTKWDFETVLDQDRTLYARWYENKTIDGDLSDWSEAELENYVLCRAHNNALETRGWTLYAKYVKDAGLWLSGYADHNTVRAASTGDWFKQTNIEFKFNGAGKGNFYLNADGQDSLPEGVSKSMVTKVKADEGNAAFPNTYRSYWEVYFPEDKIPGVVPGGPQRIGFAVATNNDNIEVGNRGSAPFWCNEGKDPANNSANGYYIYDDALVEDEEISSRGVFTNADRSPMKGSITFNSNGGSAVLPTSANLGEKVVKPTDPTKKDYTFGGWYKDAKLTTAWDFDKDVVIQSYPLFAKWTPAAKYSVTFDLKGADSAAIAPIADIWVGSTIEAPTEPTKEGSIFMGWFTDDAFEKPWIFEGNNASTVTGNTTLYAKWVAKQPFDITFETNGGTDVAAQIVMTGDLVTKPAANPTKAGYSFHGWFKDEQLTTKWNFTADKVDANTTIYAKWYKTPDANTDDWFNAEGEALYEGVSLRDATDGKRGIDVYAHVAPEGIYMLMIMRHTNAAKTDGGAWFTSTNAEFWIGGTQHWASMRGKGEKSGNVTAMKFKTEAGTDTAHVTTFELFISRNPSTQPVRMAFAAKPDGGAEKLKIAGLTATGGLDPWWMVSQNTIKAQTDPSITFGGLNGADAAMQFYVYNTGIHLTEQA